MYLLNNKRLFVGVPFSHDGYNYPANWLELSTLEERNALGILEIEDPKMVDNRICNEDGGYKNIFELKQVYAPLIKSQASQKLGETDWYVIRKLERNIDIPEEITAKRAAIVAECKRLEAWLESCQDALQVQGFLDGEQWKDL